MFLLRVGFPNPPKADALRAVRPPNEGGLLRGSAEYQKPQGFFMLSSNIDIYK